MADKIKRPSHYTFGKIEPISVIEDWDLPYHLGNVVKYIARCRYKGSFIEDLNKAKQYLELYIQLQERKIESNAPLPVNDEETQAVVAAENTPVKTEEEKAIDRIIGETVDPRPMYPRLEIPDASEQMMKELAERLAGPRDEPSVSVATPKAPAMFIETNIRKLDSQPLVDNETKNIIKVLNQAYSEVMPGKTNTTEVDNETKNIIQSLNQAYSLDEVMSDNPEHLIKEERNEHLIFGLSHSDNTSEIKTGDASGLIANSGKY